MGDAAFLDRLILEEIVPLIELVVPGVPLAAQTRRQDAKRRWTEQVRASSLAVLSPDHDLITGEVSITLVYFFTGSAALDVDNIAKPILDAIKGIILADDSIITQMLVRKTRLGDWQAMVDPPVVLVEPILQGSDFVYVRIDNPPEHAIIP